MPRHNPVSELYGQFLRPHGLVFALLTVGPYIDRCVPLQIMSNKLNLPQVDSNQDVEASQDGQWKQDAPNLIEKGLNTYANKVFQFFFYINVHKL